MSTGVKLVLLGILPSIPGVERGELDSKEEYCRFTIPIDIGVD
ncbi:hypothetical protein [Haladaptatus sp. CMAA 1911]